MPATFSVSVRGPKSLLPPLPESQIKFAVALGLTRIANAVREDERREMLGVFDRPVPYTLNSLQVVPAKRQDAKPRAFLWFKDKGGSFIDPTASAAAVLPWRRHYLLPQVFGGLRPVKAMEHRLRRIGAILPNQWIVPGWAAPLNAYGNIVPGELTRIIAWMGGFGSTGSVRNTTAQRKAKVRAAGTDYFSITAARGKMAAGLYKRTGRGASERVVQILRYLDSPPLYRVLYRFYDVARASAERVAPEIMRDAGIQALLTRKR